MSVPPTIPVRRSMLVTVVAWLYMGVSTFAILALLLETLLLPRFYLPTLHQQMASAAAAGTANFSPVAQWLLDHSVALCYGLLAVAVVHLISGIGLLRRKEWARQLFLVLLVFDALHQVAAAAMQWWVVGPMQHAMMQMQFAPGSHTLFYDQLSPQMQAAQAAQMASMLPIMDGMMAVVRVLGVISAMVFIILFGWVFKRLCRASIRREFTSSSVMA